MSFFAVLFALLIEQARPLARGNWIHKGSRLWVRWTSYHLDAGMPHHAWIVWSAAVALPSVVALLMHWALWAINPLLAFAWGVAVGLPLGAAGLAAAAYAACRAFIKRALG